MENIFKELFSNIQNENPYKILGLNENASTDIIKDAYKHLVKKNHPDKGGNKDDFCKIQSAYSLISDNSKREAYDNIKTQKETMDNFDFPLDDNLFGGNIFSSFNGDSFDIMDTFKKGMNFYKEQQEYKERKPIYIELSYNDIYFGNSKKIHFDRFDNCIDCNGLGCKDKKKMISCQACFGQGRFFGIDKMKCPACQSKGNYISPENTCKTCEGSGRIKIFTSTRIRCKKGIPSDHMLKIENIGDINIEKGENKYSDIQFKIKYKLKPFDSKEIVNELRTLKEDAFLLDDNNNVHVGNWITLEQLFNGFTKKINFVYDSRNKQQKSIKISSNSYLNPDKEYIYHNKGFPIYKSDNKTDLYIHNFIKYPENITKDYIKDIYNSLRKNKFKNTKMNVEL